MKTDIQRTNKKNQNSAAGRYSLLFSPVSSNKNTHDRLTISLYKVIVLLSVLDLTFSHQTDGHFCFYMYTQLLVFFKKCVRLIFVQLCCSRCLCFQLSIFSISFLYIDLRAVLNCREQLETSVTYFIFVHIASVKKSNWVFLRIKSWLSRCLTLKTGSSESGSVASKARSGRP